jgi:hypothetical protein
MTALSKNARIAGLLYVAASAVGVVRLMYVPKTLVVSGNASATAANIAAHESLFRIGIVCNLVGATLWLFVPLALYRLLKGVDQTLAALMVILGAVMQVPLFFVNTATDVATLLFARGGDLAAAFDQPQRDAFVQLFLELHHSIDLANAIFWGLWLIPFGMLVYRSRFFPRFLGVWVIAACFGWLAFSVTGFLFPAYEDKAFTYGQPLMIGELVMMLWLVVMGAKEPQSSASIDSPAARP